MEERKLCFRFGFWSIELGALRPQDREKAEKISEKDIPNAYGKCNAVFVDSRGNIRRFNEGKMAANCCDVRDDKNNPLFKPVSKE